MRRLRADRPLECVKRCECAHLVNVRVRVEREKGCELLNARTQLRQVECRGRVGMRRRSSVSAVARARIVQVDATAADAARSRPRMCDIISATISGGTISAKARAPELHDAASGWHLAAFRRESRVVGGATVATIQRSPSMVFVPVGLRMIVRIGNFGISARSQCDCVLDPTSSKVPTYCRGHSPALGEAEDVAAVAVCSCSAGSQAAGTRSHIKFVSLREREHLVCSRERLPASAVHPKRRTLTFAG